MAFADKKSFNPVILNQLRFSFFRHDEQRYPFTSSHGHFLSLGPAFKIDSFSGFSPSDPLFESAAFYHNIGNNLAILSDKHSFC
jgi:hypothetical protein